MFTAYFDESDSPQASVVAGVIGEVGQLSKFNTEWMALLKREGLEYFHMKEFAHHKGQFADWKRDERRRSNFLTCLIGIIERRMRIGIGVLINREDYRALAHRPVFADFYKNEYTTCGFMSLLQCSRWAERRHVEDAIAFVFDDGNAKRHDFQRAFDMAKSDARTASRYQLGSLTFANDRTVAPLQAADFIAYEFCKAYTDCMNNQHRLRRSLAQLLRRIPHDLGIGNKEALVKLAEHSDVLPSK
jgi:hypothetical protein